MVPVLVPLIGDAQQPGQFARGCEMGIVFCGVVAGRPSRAFASSISPRSSFANWLWPDGASCAASCIAPENNRASSPSAWLSMSALICFAVATAHLLLRCYAGHDAGILPSVVMVLTEDRLQKLARICYSPFRFFLARVSGTRTPVTESGPYENGSAGEIGRAGVKLHRTVHVEKGMSWWSTRLT